MNCFSCFRFRRRHKAAVRTADIPAASRTPRSSQSLLGHASSEDRRESFCRELNKWKFPFAHLAAATRNFRDANLIGEGGFGRVYKGRLDSGKVVAIKQLNLEGLQGTKEFIVEVLFLSFLQHEYLVNLIGYCVSGDERLLVYEYMTKGSLEDHLFDLSPDKKPLDWNTRINIAVGAAKGLAYLHDVASPPIIYRDLKAANILLDDDFNPRLSDFGLAKLAPVGDRTHVSTRVMGTYGYCAPDYAMSGKLNLKSDIYSFGVLLLELVTGRKAYDASKVQGEQRLVFWCRPMLNERRKYALLADPLLEGRYPPRAFQQLIIIITMCLHEQAHVRPIIGDVVVALNHVASQPYRPEMERMPQVSHPFTARVQYKYSNSK